MKKILKRIVSTVMIVILIISNLQMVGKASASASNENSLLEIEGCICYPIDNVDSENEYYFVVMQGYEPELTLNQKEEGFTWYQAEQLAEKNGGHLATITSKKEQSLIQNFLNKNTDGMGMNNYWIGAYRDLDNDKWKWVTGEEWNYTNWAAGEPNNYQSYIESYVHLIGRNYSASKTIGVWNDATNSGAKYAGSFYDIKGYGFVFERDNLDTKASFSKGVFNYPSYISTTFDENIDISNSYYYRDDYFMNDSTKYHSSLSTMSLSVALSAWGSSTGNSADDGTDRNRNIINIYNKIKFKNIQTRNYSDIDGDGVTSKEDSIAYSFANRDICIDGHNTTVISVAVRGGGYGREWSSNVTMGESGEHKGFKDAAKKISDGLYKYIEDNNISNNIKLWITGYSRAGAVANLLSGNLINGNYTIDRDVSTENVYAYCFEPAQGGLKSITNVDKEQYASIFNIVNPNDMVTLLAPSNENFGFAKYGKIFVLPCKENASEYYEFKQEFTRNLERQLEAEKVFSPILDDNIHIKLDNIGKYCYDVDSFTKNNLLSSIADILKGKELASIDNKPEQYPMNQFINEVVDIVAEEVFKNRKNYSDNYQEAVSVIVGVTMSSEAMQTYKKNLAANADRLQEYLSILDYSDTVNLLIDCLDNTGISADASCKKQLRILGQTVLSKLALRHPGYIIDLFANKHMLFQPHYPENTLAWLQSFDPNYLDNIYEWEQHLEYRELHVNCPVDVKIYDKSGSLVASINDNQAKEIENGIDAFVDYDEQKTVIVPCDNDYRVVMTATDDGTMNCNLQEFSYVYNKNTRVDNFYDISLEKGENYTLELKQINSEYGDADGCDEVYTILSNSTVKKADETFRGDHVDSAECLVKVEADGKGTVSGYGKREKGEAALIRAVPEEGYEFLGWYNSKDVQVYKDSDVKIIVKEDISLTAKFVKEKEDDSASTNTTRSAIELAVGDNLLTSLDISKDNTGISMNAWKINMNGNLHSNSNIISNCSIINVTGKCKSVLGNIFNTWQTNVNDTVKTEKLIDIAMNTKLPENSSENIQSGGYLNANPNSVVISGNNITLLSDYNSSNNIEINTSTLTTGEKDIMISSQSNIVIRTSQADFCGILFAPNGTVEINVSEFNLKGKIIAKNIVFNGSIFNAE